MQRPSDPRGGLDLWNARESARRSGRGRRVRRSGNCPRLRPRSAPVRRRRPLRRRRGPCLRASGRSTSHAVRRRESPRRATFGTIPAPNPRLAIQPRPATRSRAATRRARSASRRWRVARATDEAPVPPRRERALQHLGVVVGRAVGLVDQLPRAVERLDGEVAGARLVRPLAILQAVVAQQVHQRDRRELAHAVAVARQPHLGRFGPTVPRDAVEHRADGLTVLFVGPATPVTDKPTSAPSTFAAPTAIAIAAVLRHDRPLRHAEHARTSRRTRTTRSRRGTSRVAPGTAAQREPTSPPVSDSASPRVSPRATSNSPTAASIVSASTPNTMSPSSARTAASSSASAAQRVGLVRRLGGDAGP